MKIFENSTLHGTLGKKMFRNICPKTRSKHVWILLRTLLGIFGILKMFFFKNFRKLDRSRNTGQKNFSKNLPQNKFKTRLDTFGNDFGHFWNFASFLIFFLKIFEDSTFHGTLGKKFFAKFDPKQVQNMFGNFWERFWAFLNFEKFLIFKKNFENSTLHATVGKNIFRKI